MHSFNDFKAYFKKEKYANLLNLIQKLKLNIKWHYQQSRRQTTEWEQLFENYMQIRNE